MMLTSIQMGKIGLSNIQDGYLVNETKDRVDELEKCIDVIEQLEEKQDNINEVFLDKICEHREDIDWITDMFIRFVDLYQCKEEIQDKKIKIFKEDCKRYKRNIIIGFITSGIIDITLCIMIILQMYT